MLERDRWKNLSRLVQLNGGRLTGKTRLQKTVFLLQEMGIDMGYEFDYHYYGPYSEGVEDDTRWASFFDAIRMRPEAGLHAIPYTVFEVGGADVENNAFEEEGRVKDALAMLGRYNAVVLELAATLQYLKHNGFDSDAEKELRLRKQGKASRERVLKAKELLDGLQVRS